jgi:hypothetical protein
VDKLAENLVNKLAIFTEAARNPEDKLVGGSFKVSIPSVPDMIPLIAC